MRFYWTYGFNPSLFADSWVNFYGNIGKTLLSLVRVFCQVLILMIQSSFLFQSASSLPDDVQVVIKLSRKSRYWAFWLSSLLQVSIFFDLLFMFQHFVLYRSKEVPIARKAIKEEEEPLVKASTAEPQQSSDVWWMNGPIWFLDMHMEKPFLSVGTVNKRISPIHLILQR